MSNRLRDRAFSPLVSSVLALALAATGACQQPEPMTSPLLPRPVGAGETRVTVLHFSDYHSHAVPYFSEHMADQGGIARAVAFMKNARRTQRNVLVLNGGDMWNSGTPAWSDKYYSDCTEWRWLDGIVDAMALGNHDVDYGWDAFTGCKSRVGYPILSGNLEDADGHPLLTAAGKAYVVKQLGEVRIGIFALAGSDFGRLVKASNLKPGARFTDPLAAAKSIVAALREKEAVDAVVFIGHQDRESDFAMARAVPGIDLILGTHSHYRGAFQLIPDTHTYFISPYQYLNYVSQVELLFKERKLASVSGRLVRMNATLPEDETLGPQVRTLETALERDPKYADRFKVIGSAAVELSTDAIDRGESVLGNFAMDIVRGVAKAHAGMSTASSFRASIPPGSIRMEDYLTALPYTNKILALQMTGAQVQALLDLSLARRGSDNFGVTSGLRYVVGGGRISDVQIVRDPLARPPVYEPLRPTGIYTVMATDYLVNVAAGYKELFAMAQGLTDTGQIVNDAIIAYIRANSPVSAQLEGRVAERDAQKP